jgi:hypothetical protein
MRKAVTLVLVLSREICLVSGIKAGRHQGANIFDPDGVEDQAGLRRVDASRKTPIDESRKAPNLVIM